MGLTETHYLFASAVGASSRVSASGSNSLMALISTPIEMLVTRSRINSTTTGTLCLFMSALACSKAAAICSGSRTRIALQPNLRQRQHGLRHSLQALVHSGYQMPTVHSNRYQTDAALDESNLGKSCSPTHGYKED